MLVATPLALVVPLPGVKLPPPEAAKNDTAAPAIRLLLPSRAVTVMVEPVPPAVIVPGEAVMELLAALTGPGPTAMGPDETVVSPVAAKSSVQLPTVPVSRRSVKVASPLLLVSNELVPPSVFPVQVWVVMDTVTPAVPTGLPLASSSRTTGCCGKSTPLCTAFDGGIAKSSLVAAPEPITISPEVTPVRFGPPNVSE